jgi:hypothetical protein
MRKYILVIFAIVLLGLACAPQAYTDTQDYMNKARYQISVIGEGVIYYTNSYQWSEQFVMINEYAYEASYGLFPVRSKELWLPIGKTIIKER